MQQRDKTIQRPEMYSPVEWYEQRVDREDGEILYEAHGPKDSMVVFHGPNAKADCQLFMNAAKNTHPLESKYQAVLREVQKALEIGIEYYGYNANGGRPCHLPDLVKMNDMILAIKALMNEGGE